MTQNPTHRFKAFSITSSRGFVIRFPNQYELSTQFGGGMYSENYDIPIGSEPQQRLLSADTVEVGILDPAGNLVDLPETLPKSGDTVAGYLTIEEWLEYFDYARTLGGTPQHDQTLHH